MGKPKSIFLSFIMMILLSCPLLVANMPIFSFRLPERDLPGVNLSNDRHAYDKMNYYGYYAGPAFSSLIYSTGRLYTVNLNGSTNWDTFRSRFNAACDSMLELVKRENWRYPKPNNRMKNSYLMNRTFHPHNTDILYCILIDSMMNNISPAPSAAQKDSESVAACAKLVLKSDSLLRTLFGAYSENKDYLFIHQLAEEAFHHVRAQTAPYSFLQHANNDTIQAFVKYSDILNAISQKVHATRSNLKLALETSVLDTLIYNVKDEACEDTLLSRIKDININFFIVYPGIRESIWTKTNNLQSKIGNRDLGIRFSYLSGDENVGHFQYSFASQRQMFEDLTYKITNMKYLTLYTGQALDGKVCAIHSADTNQHWLALSYWFSMPFLVFIDQFEEQGLDSRIWASSGGSITVDSSGSVSIGQSSYIQNDSSYSQLGKAIAKFDKNSESYADPNNRHILKVYKDANNYIEFYTRKDTLNAKVVASGVTHNQMLSGTVVGSGMNDYMIAWNSSCVLFYFNNVHKHTEYLSDFSPSAANRFDTGTKIRLETGSYQQINSMKVDSVLSIYRDQIPPKIEIPSTWISSPTVYADIRVNKLSNVDVYLERVHFGWEPLRQGLKYVTTLDSVTENGAPTQVSYTFDGSADETNGDYRWMAIAHVIGGGGTDSAFGTGFNYKQNTNTVLSSAGERSVAKASALPKSFSLSQNFPNPFNPSTTIKYDIPEGKQVHVSLKVYNVRGQLVKDLVNKKNCPAGNYFVFWDGKDESGLPVSSGIYFYRLLAGDFVTTRKMVLLK